jgi:hypothetical protein
LLDSWIFFTCTVFLPILLKLPKKWALLIPLPELSIQL